MYGLVHNNGSDVHAVYNESFKVCFCLFGVLDTLHVDIPFAYYVNFNVAVVENSAPQGLLNGYRKNAGQNGGFFILVQNAASLHNLVVVKRNGLVLNVDDFPKHNDEGDDEKTEQNVPGANYAPRAFLHYKIGFYFSSVIGVYLVGVYLHRHRKILLNWFCFIIQQLFAGVNSIAQKFIIFFQSARQNQKAQKQE